MKRLESVVVFCGASTKVDKKYFECAAQVGECLAKANINIVYGGGEMGLMGALAKSGHENGAKVVAIIPPFFKTESPNVSECIVVQTMHERKKLMSDRSDGSIALPGGCGTLEELLEAITWRQLHIAPHRDGGRKPIVIVNVYGFFDPLIQMLDNMVKNQFIPFQQWVVITDPKDIVQALKEHLVHEVSEEERTQQRDYLELKEELTIKEL